MLALELYKMSFVWEDGLFVKAIISVLFKLTVDYLLVPFKYIRKTFYM